VPQPSISTLTINLVPGPKILSEKVDAKLAACSYSIRLSDALHFAGAMVSC